MAVTPANKDTGIMPQAAAAPLQTAAHEREAVIRAIGFDGIVLGGAMIRRMRRAAGLSSDALASMIGCSGALVRAWETGRRRCPPRVYLSLVETIAHVRQDKALPGTPLTPACAVASHCAA